MKITIFILLTLFTLSCTEDFAIRTNESDTRLVLAGAITNEEGPYFFRVSLSELNSASSQVKAGISDALVIISDNKGVVDTLKSLNPTIKIHPFWYYSYITVPKYSGTMDTISSVGYDSTVFKGIYYTTKVQGKPGNTYTIQIKYREKITQASDQMPLLPAIDSIKFNTKKLDKDGASFLVPYIYFKEPQDEINYYMFNFGGDDLKSLIFGGSRVWRFSIIDDTYLTGDINGLSIDDGASPVGSEDFYYPIEGDSTKIRMLSLSNSAYQYYKSIISQFENDGGAYTPTPSNPPSNLSNGALGFFRASAVNEKRVIVRK